MFASFSTSQSGFPCRHQLASTTEAEQIRSAHDPQPDSLHFAPAITLTYQPFNPAEVEDELGDDQALASTAAVFHPLWDDTRTGQLELFTAAVTVEA